MDSLRFHWKMLWLLCEFHPEIHPLMFQPLRICSSLTLRKAAFPAWLANEPKTPKTLGPNSSGRSHNSFETSWANGNRSSDCQTPDFGWKGSSFNDRERTGQNDTLEGTCWDTFKRGKRNFGHFMPLWFLTCRFAGLQILCGSSPLHESLP